MCKACTHAPIHLVWIIIFWYQIIDFIFQLFFLSTNIYIACLSSRPGQVGRADGYILEGKELEFYLRKIKAKKGK